MARCPYDSRIKCGYLYREAELMRQFERLLPNQLHKKCFGGVECPVKSDLCARLSRETLQKQR